MLGLAHQDIQRRREWICKDWLPFLVDKCDRRAKQVYFPALKELELDFSAWSLGTDESLLVSVLFGSLQDITY